MLLEKIETHLRQRRITPSRFGREALGDPKFVPQLRNGREPRSATVQRVLAYMEHQKKIDGLELSSASTRNSQP
jgi:hypothetical protein